MPHAGPQFRCPFRDGCGTMPYAMNSLLAGVFLSLLAVARLSAAEDRYNPLSVGLRWEAAVELTTPDGEVIQGTAVREITGTEEISGRTYFKSVTRLSGIPGLSQFTTYRRRAKDGIYAINGFDAKRREYLETGLPLAVGKTWTAKPSEHETMEFKVERQEKVQVNGRTHDECLKVVYHSSGAAPSGHFYLAPGSGNVSETLEQGGATYRFTLKQLSGGE